MFMIGAIWGFYEHIRDKEAYGAPSCEPDSLGSLNLLTPSRILKASRQITVGKAVSLNWALHKPYPAGYSRKALDHRVFKWPTRPGERKHVIDEEIAMNTQVRCHV